MYIITSTIVITITFQCSTVHEIIVHRKKVNLGVGRNPKIGFYVTNIYIIL